MENQVVSRSEWIEARKNLLEKEKEFSRQRDELARERQALPWVKIDKSYVFEGEAGSRDLNQLFGDKSQLIIYHFMFGPDWEVPCKSCSFWADNFNGITAHLAQRDVSFAVISNTAFEKLKAFQNRMGWTFNWVSALQTDFNQDFQVTMLENEASMYNYREVAAGPATERPGISVFYRKEDGSIYHTYSTYARGLEDMNNTYRYLDIVPKGRDEDGLAYGQEWVKIRDEY